MTALMKDHTALKIKACRRFWTTLLSKLIIKADFAVFSCLTMVLIYTQKKVETLNGVVV